MLHSTLIEPRPNSFRIVPNMLLGAMPQRVQWDVAFSQMHLLLSLH